MKIGSLFSGIGGLELGLEWAGLGETIWQVEQDSHCRSVLAKHWPDAERFDDVRAVTGQCELDCDMDEDCGPCRPNLLRKVDLICGGFPCQDISSAGRRKGLSGERSGLWSEFARIVTEIRPDWVVIENVASGAGLWVDAVTADLAELGYEALPIPLSAAQVGAPHRRGRIFIVGRLSDLGPSRRRPGELFLHDSRKNGVRVPLSADRGVGRGESLRTEEGAGRDLADPDSNRSEERAARESSDAQASSTDTDSGSVAYPNRDGQQAERLRGAEPRGEGGRQGDLSPLGHDAHGRSGARPWPPGPGDLAAWADWTAHGGPQPAIRRGPDGLPAGLARVEWGRRLAVLGNAVVPQCAEVVGHVIRELAGMPAR